MYNPDQIPDLSGRVYIVTGGTSGIGYQTVCHLIARNAKVYVGARSEAKAHETFENIQQKYAEAALNLLKMDLVDLQSVKQAAEDFLRRESSLHGLINNAGIAVTPYKLTIDGFEAQFQTNYLSHWLLTSLLLPTLVKTSATMTPPQVARVVNVSSEGHRFFAPKVGIDFGDINLSSPSISPWTRYGQSKLAGILHVKAIADKYGKVESLTVAEDAVGKIWTSSVHPGSVDTGLLTDSTGFGVLLNSLQPILRFFGNYISSEQGSWTTLYAATSDAALEEEAGNYFVPFGKKGKPSKKASDIKLAINLWDWTEAALKVRELI